MKTYWRLLPYIDSVKGYIFPYFVFSLLGSLFGIMNFTLLEPLLDVLFQQNLTPVEHVYFSWSLEGIIKGFNDFLRYLAYTYGRFQALLMVCGIILLSVGMSNIFRYLSARIIESIRAKTIASLRQSVFNHVISLDLSFFSNQRKGHLMAHMTSDIQEIENTLGKFFSATLKEIFVLVASFSVLFYRSPEITFMSLLIIPISGGTIGIIVKRLKHQAREVQTKLSEVFSTLDEVLGGIRAVKVFGAESYTQTKFKELNLSHREEYLKMTYRQEMASPMSEFLGVVVVIGILIVGGYMVLEQKSTLTASGFIAYIVLFSQVMRPAKEISTTLGSIERGKASAERIIAILDVKPTILNSRPISEWKNLERKIEWKNVSFSYDSQETRNSQNLVLKNISFTLEKGKILGLVGPSGSGKSTMADLMVRLYDPTHGEILLDGIPLKSIDLQHLRKQTAIVTQEPILFNDTIFNNICFGIPALKSEVEEAARLAYAQEFIEQLPDKYDTLIGDRGSKLSGGQKQRLSIARAILRKPSLLILDEATSSLDNESEKWVQEALNRVMKNCTTLIIAHRLTTVQQADELLVLNHGEIIEIGTHQELLEKKGLYARLYLLSEEK